MALVYPGVKQWSEGAGVSYPGVKRRARAVVGGDGVPVVVAGQQVQVGGYPRYGGCSGSLGRRGVVAEVMGRGRFGDLPGGK